MTFHKIFVIRAVRFAVSLLIVLACAVSVGSVVRILSWPWWLFHVITIATGIAGLFAHVMLAGYFIGNKTPDFEYDRLHHRPDEVERGGMFDLEIVSLWVSWICLVAGKGFVLASPFELLASLFRQSPRRSRSELSKTPPRRS